MNPVLHGMKEAYKQLGRNTFCCIFLTLVYLIGAGATSFTDYSLGGFAVSSLALFCASITGTLSIVSYVAHYFFLFVVHIQNIKTGETKRLRHSSRYVEFEGWRLHRTDGPAVVGFDVHQEDDFQLFFFEGQTLKKEVFERISKAPNKGDLNEFLTSPEDVIRNFAKHKMRSL